MREGLTKGLGFGMITPAYILAYPPHPEFIPSNSLPRKVSPQLPAFSQPDAPKFFNPVLDS